MPASKVLVMADRGLDAEHAERPPEGAAGRVEGAGNGVISAGGLQGRSEAALRFDVPGVPRPQGSKRHVGNGVMVESCKELKGWRQAVTETAIAAGAGRWDGPVRVELVFRFDRPKGHWGKRGLLPSAPAEKVTKPDLDKLSRGVLDALWPCWGDDAQVVELLARKRFCEQGELPGVLVLVERG